MTNGHVTLRQSQGILSMTIHSAGVLNYLVLNSVTGG